MSRKTLTILIAILLLIAIPLTLYQVQKQQEIRQRAAVPTFPSDFWNSNLSLSRSNKTTGDIAFCNNDATKCFVYTPTSTDGREGTYTGPMDLSIDPVNGAPWAGQIAVIWSDPDNGGVAFCSIDAKHCWLWKPQGGYTIKNEDWSRNIFWKDRQSAVTTAGRLITWTNYKAKEITFCTPDLSICWSWSSTTPNTFTEHTDWNHTNIIPWFGKDISLTWSNPRSSDVAFCNNNGTVCYLWQPSDTPDGKPGSWSPQEENWNPNLTIAPSPTPASCEVTQAVCKWDALSGATKYNVVITETATGTTIKQEVVNAPTTQLVFPASPGKNYKCEIKAENACGQGPIATAEKTCPIPSATPTITPTGTLTPTLTPTNSPTLTLTPTPTPKPTATSTPNPTLTPTSTPNPTLTPTVTPTGIPIPTYTPVPTSTVTPISTSTPIPAAPTFTPIPTRYLAQATPRPTVVPTGDSRTTIMLGVGGIILTIIGGLLLFIL